MARWTAPDLTAKERADLATINALAWDGTSHADRTERERGLDKVAERPNTKCVVRKYAVGSLFEEGVKE